MFNVKARENKALRLLLDDANKQATKHYEQAAATAQAHSLELDNIHEAHTAEMVEVKAQYEADLDALRKALSQQANEFRYILLEVARIGGVNLDMYTKHNQYEKQPRVNFKQLREDLQAHDREIERIARLDSLGPSDHFPSKE